MRGASTQDTLGTERADADYQLDLSPTLATFVREFDTLLQFHREGESVRISSLSEYLFKPGAEVKDGQRTWNKADVNAIMKWKRLPPLWRRIQMESEELEGQLRAALLQSDYQSRVEYCVEFQGLVLYWHVRC